ncbi:MAG: M24 family metallopeptidase [Eubacteriales bacterium]|jgi:Xaa-Pro aminopeptidase
MNNSKKLIGLLSKCDVDALLLTSPENRFYATDFHSTAGMVVITKEVNYFFTDFRYFEAAQEIEGFEKIMVDRDRKYNALINKVIEAHNIKRIGFEDAKMSVSTHSNLVKEINAELVATGNAIYGARASKEPWEQERMRKAQKIAEKALDEVLGLIKPGVTEKEIAAELIYHMLKNGAEDTSFDPIVVSGKNSSKPHGVPSDKQIEYGDFVTMDFGCIYMGYCSDMTRTVAVGHATDKMREVYRIVLEAQHEGIAAARAGVPGRSVDAAARKVIDDAGYGEYFGHGFGHSLGIEIHEPPNASATEEEVLPVGAVISAEPGIYLPGEFGVRIEDVLILTEDGCENITSAKKELIIL